MPEDIVRRVLRLTGYEVSGHEFDEAVSTLTLWVFQNPADPFHRCRNCGVSTRKVHDAKQRRVAEALFATALGLLAAIPAVVAYNKLTKDMDRFAGRLDSFAGEFSAILSREMDSKEKS